MLTFAFQLTHNLMKSVIISLLAITLLMSFSFSIENPPEKKPEKKANPLNVILLIGDGMGLSQVSSMYYFSETTNFSRFKQISLINTSSATHRITDSGAGGTAFAIGERTYNGAIGVGMDSLPRQNIVEFLSALGYSTGVISTSEITHATPADFYAHVKSRKLYPQIANQLVNSDVDFFAGGGVKFFYDPSKGINHIPSLEGKGFVIDTISLDNVKSFDSTKKYGFLLAPEAMPKMTDGRGDFLPSATQKAIDYRSTNQKGFFLMVEGSQIDWAGHDNDSTYMRAEMKDFDNSIGVALDFAEKNGNTLVIVLADHETGGFTLGASNGKKMEGDYNEISPSFATTSHSSALIPVFASGPGSEIFTGTYKNSEIFHKLVELTKPK